MKVTYQEDRFICDCNYNDRTIPKEAGFSWDGFTKQWYTLKPGVAARLAPYLDVSAKNKISKTRLQIEPWTGKLSFKVDPENPKDLYPFQEDAALYALARNRSYLALDMGLGKTPIAAVIAQSWSKAQPKPTLSVYICPSFLMRNTEAEFNRWTAFDVSRHDDHDIKNSYPDVVIFPDSVIDRAYTREHILSLVSKAKNAGQKTLLIVDEAHRYKTLTAKRTKSLFGFFNKKSLKVEPGIADCFDKVVYMSGTPMPNGPVELFTILNHSAPETIGGLNYFEYGKKYCAAFQTNYGWDFSGASNMEELVARVQGPFMLRKRKSEVLKDLPPKETSMVILEKNMTPRMAALDSAILKKYSPVDLIKPKIKIDLGATELHLATYRKELGLLKAGPSAEFIEHCLESSDEAVLVFAIHTDVIAELSQRLADYKPIVITGQTPMDERHSLVREYQVNAKRRLFIGNIQAAGTGLTLTKATRVIFAEFSWVPSDNTQAMDRAHRIGQDSPVSVQFLVYKNSVDKEVIETVLRKQKVVDKL